MATPYSNPALSAGGSPSHSLRARFVEAARYWEPRRLVYNFLLVGVVALWLWATWPHFRAAFKVSSLLPLTVLALLANVCYSAAYLVDISMQRSARSNIWRRRRWGLWLMGTLLAIVLANYWIVDEIYPDFR